MKTKLLLLLSVFLWQVSAAQNQVNSPDTVIMLEGVDITSPMARERQTPIAVSTITGAKIETETGNNEYPEIMKLVPGVYATKLGGGNGDARLSIRGFQQENVAILLNGVPAGSVENGLIYWSNWAGLADATRSIQVQRGLGASMVALNSVGGTVNIITKGAEATPGAIIRYGVSDFGDQKAIITLSTGLKNGWAATFLGSRTVGNGYVDGTFTDRWAYYASVTRTLGARHLLTFTALGSPEEHGQRNTPQTHAEYLEHGMRYNPNWGMDNGRLRSLNVNFYHKPTLQLNHYFTPNRKLSLNTAAYWSAGNGGGVFTESFNAPSAFSIRKDNQIDWAGIRRLNEADRDTVWLQNGQPATGYASVILTDYRATHTWAGVMSTIKYGLTEKLSFLAGAHGRYFTANLREEISDLLGARYWVDTYAWSQAGIAGRQQIKNVGDIINVDTDSRINSGSTFAQLEYSSPVVSAFGSVSANLNGFRRVDRINYVTDPESEVVWRPGFDVKGGMNYNINAKHNVYFNTGFFSKAPYYKFIFVNFGNTVAANSVNEEISALELGYGYRGSNTSLFVNAYRTGWKNKSLLSHENIQIDDNTQTRSLVRGLNALHQGLELEMHNLLSDKLMLGAMASLGDWRWTNDVFAELYDNDQNPVDTTRLYVKGLYVGDAPQTQAGLFAEYNPLKNLHLKTNWLFNSRLYAAFDPSQRNDPDDRAQPYLLPDHSIMDLHLDYCFRLYRFRTNFTLSCFNVFNRNFIMRGEDGKQHDLETFRGYWSPGRTFHAALRLEL